MYPLVMFKVELYKMALEQGLQGQKANKAGRLPGNPIPSFVATSSATEFSTM